MSVSPLRAYSFTTKDQWSRCILNRFTVQSDGSLLPSAPLRSYAAFVDDRDAVGKAVAIDPYGLLFRLSREQDELAGSPRLVVDREWVWSFDGKVVRRWDAESLQLDFEFDAAQKIRDVASDGREGIWILYGDGAAWLVHLDCKGRERVRFPAPYGATNATQLASLNRGLNVALLAQCNTRLLIVEGQFGQTLLTKGLGPLSPGWSVIQLTSDTLDRIALWGVEETGTGLAGVLVTLDSGGSTVEGPLANLFDQPDGAAPPKDLRAIRAAVYRQTVWLFTDTGLWRVDSTDGPGARESESWVITPLLCSPQTGGPKGWLRAEAFIDLDEGGALEVQIATTNSQKVKEQADAIAGNASLPAAQKQDQLWSLFGNVTTISLPGPGDATVPIAIPMLEPNDQWALLRVAVITPPGTAPQAFRGLRVLYPNLSIAENLPSIFRVNADTPTSAFRRLAGVLESTTQQLDDKIRGAASFMDAGSAPKEWLDYMARWFELPWDDGLPVDSKRRLLEHTGELLAGRATRAGLLVLLQSLFGPDAAFDIVDLTVDHAPIRVGGVGCSGGTLPALLPGVPLRTPTLGQKAVIGRSRVAGTGCGDTNPMSAIVPTLQLRITTSRDARLDIGELLRRILLQYVPAGITIVIRWRDAGIAGADVIGETGIVLDAIHLGTIGKDAAIGSSRMGGRDRGKIGDAGFGMGRLQ